jgi:2,3,4,5-tetrahydropyridine-2-carboxylate N-succinyltransferase
MGVYIGQSTRIYDRERDTVTYGRVPAGAVVVPGSLPAADGASSLASAERREGNEARTGGRSRRNPHLQSED